MYIPAWIKTGDFYRSFVADLREEQGGDRWTDEQLDFPAEMRPFFVSMPSADYVAEQSADERQALLVRLVAAAQYWLVPERGLPDAFFVVLFHQMAADLPRVQRWVGEAVAARQGSPEYLAFLAAWSRTRLTRFNTSIAARHGFLNAMIATRAGSRGDWSPWTHQAAAKNGHLDCMRYAYEHGCPWVSNQAVIQAAEKGHADCFAFAMNHGCPAPMRGQSFPPWHYVHPACQAIVFSFYPFARWPPTGGTGLLRFNHPVKELIWLAPSVVAPEEEQMMLDMMINMGWIGKPVCEF